MAHEPAWLTRVLEELAEREFLPSAQPVGARILDAIVSPSERDWPRRLALTGAATLSVSAIVLVVMRVVRGRWAPGSA